MNDIARSAEPKVWRSLVDRKSFELAEYFLSDLEGDEPTEDQKWALADVIQKAVEGWFEHG